MSEQKRTEKDSQNKGSEGGKPEDQKGHSPRERELELEELSGVAGGIISPAAEDEAPKEE